jgi:hypothetical protein
MELEVRELIVHDGREGVTIMSVVRGCSGTGTQRAEMKPHAVDRHVGTNPAAAHRTEEALA